jgi:hypothetical protein
MALLHYLNSATGRLNQPMQPALGVKNSFGEAKMELTTGMVAFNTLNVSLLQSLAQSLIKNVVASAMTGLPIVKIIELTNVKQQKQRF